ncbi:MAG: DNA repair protein RecN [Alphaproteobacteria bacterium]|nr:DNA repair protein RecN [Alphaproteobacteria bacterium]
MLLSLSIRDVVLIEKLDLTFHPGLSVLTGETGAGKSILLSALGLALGMRGSPQLVRRGARQASVTAAFEIAPQHPANRVLEENGRVGQDGLVLRRVLAADGKSRAFVDDEPASVGLLRALGDCLVELQGQAEQRGLADPSTHRPMLDAFGGLEDQVAGTRGAWQDWRQAQETLDQERARLEQAQAEEAFLRHADAELEALDPQPGEETALADTRAMLTHQEKIVEALNAARTAISGPPDAEDAVRQAGAALERVAARAAGRLDPVVAAFGRAQVELQDALAELEAAGQEIELDPARRQQVEDRYFALKDVARKHQVDVEALPALRDRIGRDLAALEDQGQAIAALERAVTAAREGYIDTARSLSRARTDKAAELDAAMAAELPPLKLEKGAFVTRVETLAEADWTADGMDRVAFEATANPGLPPGPIAKIASGGELSRLMLALKVVLTRVGSAPTLVFDEVDSGIGGATAHAVGERLARLGRELQVLVITHSPQVAARGGWHWRVVKSDDPESVVTSLDVLDGDDRREEIARMLSGQRITDEARAAAASLLAGERVDA